MKLKTLCFYLTFCCTIAWLANSQAAEKTILQEAQGILEMGKSGKELIVVVNGGLAVTRDRTINISLNTLNTKRNGRIKAYYVAENDERSISPYSDLWVSVEPTKNLLYYTAQYELSRQNGSKFVSVWVKNQKGYISNLYQSPIILDSEAPVLESVTTNHLGVQGHLWLDLSAKDNLAVAGYFVSEVNDPPEWGDDRITLLRYPQQNFRDDLLFPLPVKGKLLYVWVYDQAGNRSDPAAVISAKLTGKLESLGQGGEGKEFPQNPWNFIVLNEELFFTGDDQKQSHELWKYNPSTREITKLSEFGLQGKNNGLRRMTVFQNQLFFWEVRGDGLRDSHQNTLWKYDLYTGLEKIGNLANWGYSYPFVEAGGKLYFVLGLEDSMVLAKSNELWEVDGKDWKKIATFKNDSFLYQKYRGQLVATKDRLYFVSRGLADEERGIETDQVWFYDLVTEEIGVTSSFHDQYSNQVDPKHLTVHQGQLYFMGRDRFWNYDPFAQVHQMYEQQNFIPHSYEVQITSYQDKLYFCGPFLWVIGKDGIPKDLRKIHKMNTSEYWYPKILGVSGDSLFFTAEQKTWRYDGVNPPEILWGFEVSKVIELKGKYYFSHRFHSKHLRNKGADGFHRRGLMFEELWEVTPQ